jgi:cell division protein ZapA
MEQIEVRILDRDYKLAVSAEERSALLDSAQVVDDKMRAIRDAGKVSGLDRIAVMAALQLAHELLASRHGDGPTTGEMLKRIRKMTDDIDAELQRQSRLFE